MGGRYFYFATTLPIMPFLDECVQFVEKQNLPNLKKLVNLELTEMKETTNIA